VLAVSSASPLVDDLRELAAATPGLEVAVVAPEELNAAQLAHADIAIFHRVVPNPAPAVNALYIYPPGENGLFPASGDAQNIEVLDWNDRHPVLQSLQPLAALPLQRARMMAAPPWSQVLLWSRTIDREFPLAFAGERDGHRVACIAFDLEAERLLSSDNLNFFLFFMNLLDWLTPQGDPVHVVRTGEVQALDALPPGPLDARDPRGITSTLPATQRTLQPLFAGEYRIGVDGTSRRLLANFFDPTESDIGRASREAPIFHEAARLVRDTPEAPHNEYGAWLYYAAAALLLLEWIVARRIAT
jgi:hypothetical protein